MASGPDQKVTQGFKEHFSIYAWWQNLRYSSSQRHNAPRWIHFDTHDLYQMGYMVDALDGLCPWQSTKMRWKMPSFPFFKLELTNQWGDIRGHVHDCSCRSRFWKHASVLESSSIVGSIFAHHSQTLHDSQLNEQECYVSPILGGVRFPPFQLEKTHLSSRFASFHAKYFFSFLAASFCNLTESN
jgi:hypothetical protein